MAKVAYKAKYEEANARIAELERIVQQLADTARSQGEKRLIERSVKPKETVSTKAAKPRKASARKAQKAPANVGTCTDVVLINPEDNSVALSLDEAIKENQHGRQVNFAFITAPDAEGNANVGKPTPEILDGVRERNTFRGRGYVPSAKRWFMELSNFRSLVAEFDLTVHGE